MYKRNLLVQMVDWVSMVQAQNSGMYDTRHYIVLGSAPVNDCQRAPANSRGLLQDTKTLLGVFVHTEQVISRWQRKTTAIRGGNVKIQNRSSIFMSNHRKALVPPIYTACNRVVTSFESQPPPTRKWALLRCYGTLISRGCRDSTRE